MAISRDILNRETNARFWASTGYRPGQRLDPKNPTDKAMMPVWMDIYHKVQAEDKAGTLVTTYDHPEVVQHLSDAEVASKAAAVHADAAAKATDPQDAQANTAAATTAAQIAAQKAREAAARQPPTVSHQLVQDAAKEAAKTPPPPHASAADHIAHAQTQVPMKPPVPPREVLYQITNQRFWNRTHYKEGQRLDMSNAEDRRQAKIWTEIFHEVEREANEGRLELPQPTPPPQPTRPPGPPPGMAMLPPPWTRMPPMQPGAPMPQRGMPMQPGMPMPPGMIPQRGMPMQPGAPMPPPQMPGMPPQQPGAMPPGPPMEMPSAPEGASSSETPPMEPAPAAPSGIRKYLAIGIAAIAGGGLLYYATTRTPSRAPSYRRRSPSPRIIVATTRSTPARAIPARAIPALPGLPPRRTART